MIKDFPVFGVGPGAWYSIFPKYRSDIVVPGYFEFAHNDYAQFAAEFGAIGFVIVAVIVLWSFGMALMAHARRRDPLMRGISFGAMMAIIAIMIHSSVDFNLQIAANALYFMVVLALAWISFHMDRRDVVPQAGKKPARHSETDSDNIRDSAMASPSDSGSGQDSVD
jgi:O-antigen ligase